MNHSISPWEFLIGVCVGILLYLIIKWFFLTTYETVVETSDDNPILKAKSEYRGNIISNIINSFLDAWELDPKEVVIQTAYIDFGVNVINSIYKNHFMRLYCDWDKNILKIHYTTNENGETSVVKKVFTLKSNKIDFEKINDFFLSIKPKEAAALDEKTVEHLIQSAKDIANNEKVPAEESLQMILEGWAQLKEALLINASHEMAMQFSTLTAFLQTYFPKEFEDFQNKD